MLKETQDMMATEEDKENGYAVRVMLVGTRWKCGKNGMENVVVESLFEYLRPDFIIPGMAYMKHRHTLGDRKRDVSWTFFLHPLDEGKLMNAMYKMSASGGGNVNGSRKTLFFHDVPVYLTSGEPVKTGISKKASMKDFVDEKASEWYGKVFECLGFLNKMERDKSYYVARDGDKLGTLSLGIVQAVGGEDE